ncbi:23S rRNA (uridine(2479)-2'-O)-methyltransferase [Clostridiales bacterium]|nr:23S rRNA (uridine(2479)-2'-O)-methyltransferase [Clostridiales bacterium]
MIESSHNKIIKEIKALGDKKNRDESGLFIVDGFRFVSEIPDTTEIRRMIFSESFAARNDISAYMKRADCHVVGDSLFSSLSDTKSPQGIMAVCRKMSHSLDKIVKRNGFYIIAEEINDPGNLGTIIRTAHAAGINGVLISEGCVDLYNPKVLRSTMGSIFKVPIIVNADLQQAVDIIRMNGIKIYAAHLKGEKNYYELYLKNGGAFMLGNEARGLSQKASNMCDSLVRIPMPGGAESLNAAVAASILIYETVRQRMG